VTISLLRRSATALVLGGLIALPSACVAPGPGSGPAYDDNMGVGVDYYEPYGYDYGGWDSGYAVGPYRDHGHNGEPGRGNPGPHSYRSAPASHSMPSMPSASRSGGSHR
jgi:hypothetical protein